MEPLDTGEDLHSWATDLFPVCRSLTGDGVRQTLAYLQRLAPQMTIHAVPSGTVAMDWNVPDEWNIRDAYVKDEAGNRVIDFRESNLHVVGYSEPVDIVLSRAELDEHLHSIPELPNAIPYVTSYYRRTWGFCLSQLDRDALGDGPFRVVVDSTLEPGDLVYGEIVLPGSSPDEILLSTYVCHPSMANNELSGPMVAIGLARWLSSLPTHHYTYRIVFLPETIGSLTYLSKHLDHLRTHVQAGWVLTCIGDERTYSYVPSRQGATLADRVSLRVIDELGLKCDVYSFLDRGSDERQYCAPGVDLPVASLMRSKYGTFAEYHTSLDNLDFVTPEGLQGGLDMMVHAVRLVEANRTWKVTMLGEPQMGRRGLYPTTSTRSSGQEVREMMNVLAYCDGATDVLEIAEICEIPALRVAEIAVTLNAAGILEAAGSPHSDS